MRSALIIGLAAAALAARGAAAQETIKVGWCAKTVTSAAVPYAIANKLGWYAADGIKVELSPLPGSTDCVKLVATGDLPFSVPSIEPLAIIHPQGVDAKVFYTAYQGNIYGINVPADSPIKALADLRGKKIGVQSMGSAGVIIARAVAETAGLNPDHDVSIVVIGESAQAAAMVRGKQVDALSLYDTQYALIEQAGVKLRELPTPTSRYPANGFIALDSTLKTKRKIAVAVAKGYAMGTVFAMTNPEAAIRIMYEVFPQTRSTGKDEATAIHDDELTMNARAANWKLEKGGVSRWGESNMDNYAAYIDFLVKNGVVKQKVDAKDIVTNDLIADINTFDPAKVAAEAKAYKVK